MRDRLFEGGLAMDGEVPMVLLDLGYLKVQVVW
jgi:hypothetical protein